MQTSEILLNALCRSCDLEAFGPRSISLASSQQLTATRIIPGQNSRPC
jgi:hypothetical protein